MSPLPRVNRFSAILLSVVAGLLCALLLGTSGCRSLPRSGFDPSGERLFESRPFADCPLFKRKDNSPTITASTPQPETNPATLSPALSGTNGGASIYTPPVIALPGELGAAKTQPTNPNQPNAGTTATTLPPNAHAITTALIPNPDTGGLASPHALDSPLRTVESVLSEHGGYALPIVPVEGPALIMTPKEQIAPLGSEVVLVASYLGSGDRLVTNEKVEWTLEGIGTLEKFDPGSCCDPLVVDYVKAKKINERYVVTKTSRIYQTLDRGTADTADDINLLRGQTWVSVNSMREGTTHVTAFAPNMADWSKRTDAGIVHWVDAQWVLPRLSIAPVGENRVLTTTVLRATNGQPRRGWIVRYEILSGPPAGFGPTLAQIEEVQTDISGQATVILNPRDAQSGANAVGIQIIRPAGVDGSDRRITVGCEQVRQTWTGTPNILLNIKGLNEAKLGQELPYELTVTNRTSSHVQGMVSLPLPPSASYIRSTPPGQVQGQTVTWNVNAAPNSTEKINLVLRQNTAGSLWLRPEFNRTDSNRAGGNTIRAGGFNPPTTPPVNPPTTPAPRPGATVFPGSTPNRDPNNGRTPPPAIPPRLNPNPPATLPKPSLTLRIDANPGKKVESGKPVNVYAIVENTGTMAAQNVDIRIPLPPEMIENVSAASKPCVTGDTNPLYPVVPGVERGIPRGSNIAMLRLPSLAAKETAHLQLWFPAVPAKGFRITAEVHADGQQISQAERKITP